VLEKFKEQDWSFLKGVKEGIFTVPGDSNMVDWNQIFAILKSSDYSGWVVIEAEQDPSKADPLEYALIARKFLRENLEK
jgi:inosose dehydratase